MLNNVYTTEAFHFAKTNDLMDFDVAKRVSEVLMKHYPNYAWGVNVSSETGMVQVRNFSLSGIWGFNLHMSRVQEDIHGTLIKNAGGEILERFRVKRGMANTDQLEDLPVNAMGLIVPDTIEAK